MKYYNHNKSKKSSSSSLVLFPLLFAFGLCCRRAARCCLHLSSFVSCLLLASRTQAQEEKKNTKASNRRPHSRCRNVHVLALDGGWFVVVAFTTRLAFRGRLLRQFGQVDDGCGPSRGRRPRRSTLSAAGVGSERPQLPLWPLLLRLLRRRRRGSGKRRRRRRRSSAGGPVNPPRCANAGALLHAQRW